MITKDMLKRMEAQRPKKNLELHYRPGGAIEQHVHSCSDAQRIGHLNKGYRELEQRAEEFRTNMAFKAREGQSRSAFNHANQNNPRTVPAGDRPIAEKAWGRGYPKSQKQTLNEAAKGFRRDLETAARKVPEKEPKHER